MVSLSVSWLDQIDCHESLSSPQTMFSYDLRDHFVLPASIFHAGNEMSEQLCHEIMKNIDVFYP